MKTSVRQKVCRLAAALLMAIALLAIPACGGKEDNTPPQKPPAESTLDYTVVMPSGLEYKNPSAPIDIFIYEQCKIVSDAENVVFEGSGDAITVSQNGVVTAKSVGTGTVKLKSGDNVATLGLNVNASGNIPFVTFDNSNVLIDDDGNFNAAIASDRTLNIGATVKYNGISYQVTGFSFESSDKAVATVSDGRITAVGEGTAVITVSLPSWNGYTGETLTETVNVTVRPNGSIELAKNEITVYTSSTDTLSDTFDLAPVVHIDGQEVANPTVVYSGYDNTVISVEGNVVYGLKAGSTTVTATYTTAKGTEFFTTVNVKVELPVTALDKSLVVERTQSFDLTALLGLDDFTIASAWDITAANATVELTESGALDSDKFVSGERTWVIYSVTEGYKFNVTVADKIIKNKAELVALEGQVTSGYYMLGANIDMGRTNFTGLAGASGTFGGTFNGNGYAIKDAIYTAGLVGGTLGGGTVKNIALIDSEVNGGAHGGIAGTASGKSTIENVFIQLRPALTAWTNSTGAAFYQQEGTLTAVNVIAYMQDHRPGNTANSSFIHYTKQGAVINATNVIAGSDVNRTGGTGVEMKPVGSNQGTTNGTVTNFASLADMQAATFDISAFGDFTFIEELKTFLNRKQTVQAVVGNTQTNYTQALTVSGEILSATLNGQPLSAYSYGDGNFVVAVELLTEEENTILIKTKLIDYELKVQVRPDAIELAKTDVTIYTENAEGHSNTFDIAPVVRVNGAVVQDAQVDYSGFDTDVVSVQNGVITAVAKGTTTVTLTYTPEGGSQLTASVTVTVAVYLPITDLDKKVVLDKTVTASELATLLNVDGFTLASAEDVTTAAAPVTIAEDGAFDSAAFVTGERTWTVFSDSVGYKFNVTVADKIIKNKAELVALEGQVTSGYYMLGAEIDMEGADYTGLADANSEFTGTFDGQGYAIKNMISKPGLLGSKAANVTVRNLAIVDSGVHGAAGGALAGYVSGTSKLENVFIRLNPASAAVWTNSTASVFFQQDGGVLTANNVIAYMEDHRNATAVTSSFIYYTKTGSKLNVTNVIAGSNVNREGGTGAEMKPIGNEQGTTSGTITNYASLAEMQSANIDTSAYASFNYYKYLTAFLTAQ